MKRITVPLFFFIFYGLMTNAQPDLKKGLVVYYPFNGNAKNSVSSNFNGVVNGAILNTDRFGEKESAYFFDGINDRIDIVDFGDSVPSSEISVSIWIRSLKIQWSFQLMLCPDNNRFAFSANWGGRDYWDFGWRGDGGDAPGRLYYSSDDDNAWHHYVLISNTNNGTMKIYKDNVLKAYKSYPLQLLDSKSKDLRIGGGDGESFFNGLLDDIRIYNRQISEEEVAMLYLEDKPCDINITKQPVDCSVLGGSSSSFSVRASGENIVYQWQANSGSGFKDLNNDCFYSGCDSDELSISTVSNLMHNNQFRCIMTSKFCIDTTDIASIKIDSSKVLIFDTIHTTVIDSVHVTLFDTVYSTVFDTVQIMNYDTTFIAVTDTLVIDIFTSSNSYESITVKVYPNPAKDVINIDFGDFDKMKGCYVKLINSLSQIDMVRQVTRKQMSIDVSSLSGRGIYLLQIVNNMDKIVAIRKIVLK